MPPGNAPAPNVQPDLGALIAVALGRPVAATERLAVAVSGGPDSLALLALAQAEFAGRLTAITVDHGLRAESAAEAAGVAAQCAARAIAHVTLARDGAPITRNVQAQARAARYDLLGNWCAANGHALLLTAHHADDQAETLLMRLNRASGSDGLAGIRAARPLRPGVWPGVLLVRPLLALRKAELLAIAAAGGWQVVNDPSNHDPRHDRSRMRDALAASGLDVPALARAAGHLANEAAALDWATDLAWQGRVIPDGPALLFDARGLPAALVQRLLARAMASLGNGQPRGPDLARLAARLSAGRAGTLVGVVARPGPIWRLQRAKAHQKSQSGHEMPPNPPEIS
jgi:tRNA(Ile)-lysidine synthase